MIRFMTCLICALLAMAEAPGADPATARELMAPALAPAAVKADFHRVEDRGFLRRIWLDLAGRLPDPQTTAAFLADTRADKHARAIDQVIASEAFTERWTTFFADMFQNYAIEPESAVLRNAFHRKLRAMVAANTPWDQMAREVIDGHGPGGAPDAAMFFWLKQVVDNEYRLDYLDDQAAWISDAMLGVQTRCISCHDGQYHLEQVNVGLATMTRRQFWGLAAFLSSARFYLPYERLPENEEPALVYFFRNMEIADLDSAGFDPDAGAVLELMRETEARGDTPDGEYRAVSSAGQGMRPPRNGGVVAPAYPFSGQTPRPGETRRAALARILTADRQFARNMVNRIWAHLLGEGFVTPVNGWDLARLDEATAAANETTVQPRNGFLMEFLTDWFIDNGYDIRGLIRLIVNSKVYQWDYAPVPGGGAAADAADRWGYWRDNKRVRRIEAEAVVDNFFQIMGLEPKFVIAGQPDRVYASAWALPDPGEPSEIALFEITDDGGFRPRVDPGQLGAANLDELLFYMEIAQTLQAAHGRGDYAAGRPRDNGSDIQNALTLMNDFLGNIWLEEWRYFPKAAALIRNLDAGALDHESLTTGLFRDMLFREPTAKELSLTLAGIREATSERAVTDVIWALFNHPDYLYR